jgi:nucleoid-associated protein Lsr2
MAKRVIHELIDDLNGQAADETITFALDGVQYEIDLTNKNASKLRGVLAPYVAAGTRIGRGGVTASRGREARGRSSARSDRQQNQAIREWAVANGIPVSDRGRIKREVVERYKSEVGR